MSFLEGLLYVMWRGLAIGVIISAPMGPVGILCIQRTLEKGRLSGFFTGVGASISDLFYCLLTGFGLSLIEGFLKANQNIIQIIGSVVLIIFGIYLFKSTPARKVKKPGAERTSKGKNILSGFLFTVSNPLIIFLIIGLFARFDFFLPEITFHQYLLGYLCIISGALIWWWFISFFVDKVRAHFNVRSMWLVNKITGSIIMLFAIVGIVTAFTNTAKGDSRPPLYLNSVRGFGELNENDPSEGALILSNPTSKPIARYISLNDAEDFSFSFRAANLNNASGKKYNYFDSEGKRISVVNPAWGVILKNNKDSLFFRIKTIDNYRDELYGLNPLYLSLSCMGCGVSEEKKITTRNFDYFTGDNSFIIRHSGSEFSIAFGNTAHESAMEIVNYDFLPDSIGFIVEPGALLRLDYMSFNVHSEGSGKFSKLWTVLEDEGTREAYFDCSSDDKEGLWEIYDRMLEEDFLSSGGNYKFALIGNESGYELVYLEGAVKNRNLWKPGMVKARLAPTSFKNVYDVTWFDPSCSQLVGEIKAQFNDSGLVSLHFPDHGSSTLRLRKVL